MPVASSSVNFATQGTGGGLVWIDGSTPSLSTVFSENHNLSSPDPSLAASVGKTYASVVDGTTYGYNGSSYTRLDDSTSMRFTVDAHTAPGWPAFLQADGSITTRTGTSYGFDAGLDAHLFAGKTIDKVVMKKFGGSITTTIATVASTGELLAHSGGSYNPGAAAPTQLIASGITDFHFDFTANGHVVVVYIDGNAIKYVSMATGGTVATSGTLRTSTGTISHARIARLATGVMGVVWYDSTQGGLSAERFTVSGGTMTSTDYEAFFGGSGNPTTLEMIRGGSDDYLWIAEAVGSDTNIYYANISPGASNMGGNVVSYAGEPASYISLNHAVTAGDDLFHVVTVANGVSTLRKYVDAGGNLTLENTVNLPISGSNAGASTSSESSNVLFWGGNQMYYTDGAGEYEAPSVASALVKYATNSNAVGVALIDNGSDGLIGRVRTNFNASGTVDDATATLLGVFAEAATSGNEAEVAWQSQISDDHGGLTAGTTYYVSPAGAITSDAVDSITSADNPKLGIAISSTQLLIDVEADTATTPAVETGKLVSRNVLNIEDMLQDFADGGTAHIFADGDEGARVAGQPMLRYVNDGVAPNRINWYFFAPTGSVTLNDIQSIYAGIDNRGARKPYLTVYTKPLGAGDLGGFYRSRINYELTGNSDNGQMLLHSGSDAPEIFDDLKPLELPLSGASSQLVSGYESEDILYMVLSTDSSAAASEYDFDLFAYGYTTANTRSEVTFNEPEVSSVSWLADGDALPTSALEGDEAYVTSDGTSAGTILKRYVRDSSTWVKTTDHFVAEFIHAEIGSDQVVTASGTTVTNWTTNENEGLTLSSGAITLKGGISYKLKAALNSGSSTNMAWAVYRFYNVTDGAYFGSKAFIYPTNHSTEASDQHIVTARLSPNADTVVELRVEALSGTSFQIDSEYGFLDIEAVAGQNPVTNKLVDLSDVQTLPHAQQTTISKGATLRCFDGTNWESDTVEGVADINVAFNTPWGLTLYLATDNGSQFFWRNDTGTNKYGSQQSTYGEVSTAVSSTSSKAFTNLGSIGQWLWADNSLDFLNHGDHETMRLRWADSQDAWAAGNYQEFEATCIIGGGYVSNRFVVRRLR